MKNYGETFLNCLMSNDFCEETEKKLDEILNQSTKAGYQKGDILTYRDHHGLDAIFYAVYFGNVSLLEFLLKNKADPNTFYFIDYVKPDTFFGTNFLGSSPLTLILAPGGRIPLDDVNKICKLLISYGASPNLSFMDYVRSNNSIYEVVVSEMQNYHNKSTSTSFNARVLDTYKRMYCDVLITATYLNHKNKFPRNLDVNRGLRLINTLESNNINVEDFLKFDLVSFIRYKEWIGKADRSYEVADIENNIPLIQAVRSGYHEAALLLIEVGADVNVLGAQNSTPLHNAMWYGFEDMAKTLIEKGANTNCTDSNGFTPIIYGYRRGYNELCENITSMLKGNKIALNK